MYDDHAYCETCGKHEVTCWCIEGRLPELRRQDIAESQAAGGVCFGHAQWFNTGSHSFCPACGSPEVRVRQVLDTRMVSLPGVQLKYEGTWVWTYLCFACGDHGPCEIREGYNARAIREWKSWSPG